MFTFGDTFIQISILSVDKQFDFNGYYYYSLTNNTEYSDEGDMWLLKAKQTYYAMKNDATLLSNWIAMLQNEENKLLKKI